MPAPFLWRDYPFEAFGIAAFPTLVVRRLAILVACGCSRIWFEMEVGRCFWGITRAVFLAWPFSWSMGGRLAFPRRIQLCWFSFARLLTKMQCDVEIWTAGGIVAQSRFFAYKHSWLYFLPILLRIEKEKKLLDQDLPQERSLGN